MNSSSCLPRPPQRQLLDEYAGALDLRAQIAEAFTEQRRLEEKLEELSKNEQERLRLLDLWTFQRKEIESVQPRLGKTRNWKRSAKSCRT